MLALSHRRHPFITRIVRPLTWSATGYAWAAGIAILASGIYFDWIRFSDREFVLRAMGAPGLAWVFVQALKHYWKRRRPFQILDGYQYFSAAPGDDSFPSGHTASAFAFLIAMLPLGAPATFAIGAWAILIGFSRYYLGVHFPTDIFAGAIIGCLAGVTYDGILPADARNDRYPSYTALAETLVEGSDFRVTADDRGSSVLVLAIHGGRIEPGSDSVAEQIAGTDWSRYVFRALRVKDHRDLHVTSTHFDDPRALALAAKSRLCISVHGYKNPGKQEVCLGGGNRKFRGQVEAELRRALPSVPLRIECPSIAGTDSKNIVNRCLEAGVQLELPGDLRDRLGREPKTLATFAEAIRKAADLTLRATPQTMESE